LKRFIRNLSSRAIHTAFGIAYGAALMMALFPPFYLAASGVQTPILGIPFSLFYWIADALLVGLALWALYAVEDIRGELDDDTSAIERTAAS
jgi:TRAP-type C4-dicarboxylate transport system permease small subunit